MDHIGMDVYLVKLLFSFKGVKRLEVPLERIRPQ